MLQQYAGALTVPDMQHYHTYMPAHGQPSSCLCHQIERTSRGVCEDLGLRTCASLNIQKSKEATASSASLLATPMLEFPTKVQENSPHTQALHRLRIGSRLACTNMLTANIMTFIISKPCSDIHNNMQVTRLPKMTMAGG